MARTWKSHGILKKHSHEALYSQNWVGGSFCLVQFTVSSFLRISTQVGLCRQLLEYGESIFGIWLIHVCDMSMTHSCVWHVPHMNESSHTHESVMSHTWMSHGILMKHSHEALHSRMEFLRNFYTGRALQAAAWVRREYLRYLRRATSPDYYRRHGQCGICVKIDVCIYMYVCRCV